MSSEESLSIETILEKNNRSLWWLRVILAAGVAMGIWVGTMQAKLAGVLEDVSDIQSKNELAASNYVGKADIQDIKDALRKINDNIVAMEVWKAGVEESRFKARDAIEMKNSLSVVDSAHDKRIQRLEDSMTSIEAKLKVTPADVLNKLTEIEKRMDQ